jgi:hypothetical protein
MKRSIAILGALLACSMTGCSFSTDDPAGPPVSTVDPTLPGSLVIRWTIAGVADPNECVRSIVAKIEISIVDTSGNEVAAYQQVCETFATTITLSPGPYSASAVLLDSADRTRTTDVIIAPFTLRGNEELTISIDFPSNSFR